MKINTGLMSLGLLAVSMSLVTDASARYGRGGRYHPRGGRICSPEMKESTISTAEKVLTEAANSKEFEGASQFKDFVTKATKIEKVDEKLQAYFSVLGVNSQDADAVANFVGARDHAEYRAHAEKTLGLTPSQAEVLVGKFSKESVLGLTQ